MAELKPSVVPFPSHLQLRDVAMASANPFQAAAEMRVQMLQTLFGILVTVEGFPEAGLLREVFHNASRQLSEVQMLYRRAIAHTQRRTADE